MTKRAHPRPGMRAVEDCVRLAGRCPCWERARGSGTEIPDRAICEDRYQRAIQDIIAEIRKDDPQ